MAVPASSASGGTCLRRGGGTPFTSLPPEEQAAIRDAQRARKQAKTRARAQTAPEPLGEAGHPLVDAVADHDAIGIGGSSASAQLLRPFSSSQEAAAEAAGEVRNITSDQYFEAAGGGLFRDPNLKPTEANLALLLEVLRAGDEQAHRLNTCAYFQFSGSPSAMWDPRFNARMAYEGFFTITTGRRHSVEPLPELQPFYSVVAWPNFEASRHVRKALHRLRRGERRYYVANCLHPLRTWELLDAYHRKKYGSNWLTKQYFEMLMAASADASINFKLQCVEMYSSESEAEPLAGEIGFSIGAVYTSLSGWTEERTSECHGTSQLVLLGRWLQSKNFVFWSLGHCYSPEMDYKRQLGHRVLPRYQFLSLLAAHRGDFRLPSPGTAVCAFAEGDRCEGQLLWDDAFGEPAAVVAGERRDPLTGVRTHVAVL